MDGYKHTKKVYTMKQRLVIINHNANSYRKASKKTKSQMLNRTFSDSEQKQTVMGSLLRKSAKVVLRNGNIQILTDATYNEKSKRGKKGYSNDVLNALEKI